MNILVVRNDKLGDFITALPAIYVLKKYNQNNKIIVLVAPLNKAIAMECDFIDDIIVDDEKSVWSLAKKIKDKKIDTSITLFSNTRIAIAQFLARIPKRIAPATKIAQIFYTNRVKQRRSQVEMAEFEYNLELTKELFKDINLEYRKPLLEFEDSKNIYDVFCKKNKIEKEIVAFHVGFGGSSDANWNLDEYEILIKEVLREDKYQVLMTFGPDEQDLYENMRNRFKDSSVIFYNSVDGIIYFCKLISNFKLFVSTSTGTYHLASMVGTPTMTFFGSSLFASSKRWKSIGEDSKQKHFMIPVSVESRSKLFEDVKRNLEMV